MAAWFTLLLLFPLRKRYSLAQGFAFFDQTGGRRAECRDLMQVMSAFATGKAISHRWDSRPRWLHEGTGLGGNLGTTSSTAACAHGITRCCTLEFGGLLHAGTEVQVVMTAAEQDALFQRCGAGPGLVLGTWSKHVLKKSLCTLSFSRQCFLDAAEELPRDIESVRHLKAGCPDKARSKNGSIKLRYVQEANAKVAQLTPQKSCLKLSSNASPTQLQQYSVPFVPMRQSVDETGTARGCQRGGGSTMPTWPTFFAPALDAPITSRSGFVQSGS